MKLTNKALKMKIKALENELDEANDAIRELGRENHRLRRNARVEAPTPLKKFLDDKIGLTSEVYGG